jgi:hypothetical protein
MEVCTGPEPSATMGPHGQTFAVACTLSIAKPPSYDPEDTYHIFLWTTGRTFRSRSPTFPATS